MPLFIARIVRPRDPGMRNHLTSRFVVLAATAAEALDKLIDSDCNDTRGGEVLVFPAEEGEVVHIEVDYTPKDTVANWRKNAAAQRKLNPAPVNP